MKRMKKIKNVNNKYILASTYSDLGVKSYMGERKPTGGEGPKGHQKV